MGANQSQDYGTSDVSQHNITVVNPDRTASDLSLLRIDLPSRAPPILGVDNHTIDPLRHKLDNQLDPQLWIDLVKKIERLFKSQAEVVASRQAKLQQRIALADAHVEKFTDSYINHKHKALARMNDDCKKIDEMRQQINKCSLQANICIDMLNKLNFLLPDDLKLEELDLKDEK